MASCNIRNVTSVARRADQAKVAVGKTSAVIRRASACALIWLILAGASLEALALGAAVVPFTAAFSLRLLPVGKRLRLRPVLPLIPRFIWRSLIGGVDVAWRAFHPRLPIKPGWVAVRIGLRDGGKVFLGGELSLMPGTLSAGFDGGRMLIHVLDRDQDIEPAVRDDERGVARVLDESASHRSDQAPGST